MIQGRFRSRVRAALTSAAILLPALALTATTPITASASTTRTISGGAVTSFAPKAPAVDTGGVQTPEIRPATEGSPGAAGPDVAAAGGAAQGTGDAGSGATVATKALTFEGLFHRQQRLANGGNQFSLEPPDQGLCVGNGFVLETVNDVMRVYNTAGTPVTAVQDLNSFYKYAAQVDRTTGLQGPFVTDPSCFYDPSTRRWFHVVLTLDVDPVTGAFLGSNHLDLAVSQTSNPAAGWKLYSVPVQDDGTGGTVDHGCSASGPVNGPPKGHGPCIGDYPHLGMDANGFYVTTNEYSLRGPEFHGAQVYAFSKRALVSGATAVTVTQFDTHGMDNGNSGFTLAPATSPTGDEHGNNGAEYFLSSNGTDEAHGQGFPGSVRTSKQVIVWTLENTQSLNSHEPNLTLRHDYVGVDRYSNPPPADQRSGSTPLRDCLNDPACFSKVFGISPAQPNPFAPEQEYALDSNDSRMLQTILVGDKLWGSLDTALNGKAGIEWFQVNVGGRSPRLVKDGYLGLHGQNLIYPAIGLTAGGQGVMAFTVVGSEYFPSAGYATLDNSGTGKVQIAKLGVGPADGFSGYNTFGNPPGTNRPRWGDYGASAIVGNSVWIASEMINQTCDFTLYQGTATSAFGSCNGRRSTLANWSTEITKIDVSSSNGGNN
jgi:hypothetical protein